MFDYLNKVLYKTKGPDTSKVQESEEFVPFMIQRWGSMYSPEIARLINETSNRQWPGGAFFPFEPCLFRSESHKGRGLWT